MGLTEFLTILFVALKLLGVITWSWWLVLLPEIIAAAFYVLMIVLNVTMQLNAHKSIRKHFHKF